MEFDECLIELVHSRPELYDMSDRRYSDAVRKEAVWKDIGDEMGRPGPECKRRWISLRDQFRRHVNRKTKSGEASVPKKFWKYEEIMSFLLPFLQERETVTNVTVAPCGDGEVEELNEEEFLSSVALSPPATESQLVSPPTSETSRSSICSTPTSSQRAVKRKQPIESASASLMQYILSRQTTDDHIESFLAAIGSSMKRLSPLRQLQARDKIYAIVSNLELEQLKEET